MVKNPTGTMNRNQHALRIEKKTVLYLQLEVNLYLSEDLNYFQHKQILAATDRSSKKQTLGLDAFLSLCYSTKMRI